MYTILIVDDEPLAIRGLKSGVPFQKLGFDQVYAASNATEAKSYFSKRHIDILLCDIEMPGDNGLIFAQWVNDYYPDTVILFLTAHANFSYAQDAVRLMAFRYMLKPIAYTELTNVLADALKKLPSMPKYSIDTVDTACGVASDSDSAIVQTVEYIRNNLHEPLSRESLGKNVYLNPNYLARIFKEEIGSSLVTYITDLRLETSRHLLHSTSLSIGEICQQVGFHDHSYFAKQFKRKYGVSPKQYREESQVLQE